MWQSPYEIWHRNLRLLHEDSGSIWDRPGSSFQAPQRVGTAGQYMYSIALGEEAVG